MNLTFAFPRKRGVCRKKGLKRFKGLFIVESADLAYPANLQALHSDT